MFLPLAPNQIVWESLDPAIASVTLGVVSGLAPGVAVIQGTYGNMSQQVVVAVGPMPDPPPSARVVRLRIYGAPAMRVSQRAGFGVLPVFDNGTTGRASVSAVWTSSKPSIAGLSPQPALSGVNIDAFSVGSAALTASYQGLTATMTVSVQQ